MGRRFRVPPGPRTPVGQALESRARRREGGSDRERRGVRGVWRPRGKVLERLPQVRRGLRLGLFLFLVLLRRGLLRIGGLNLYRVGATRPRSQDWQLIVQVFGLLVAPVPPLTTS